MLTGVSDTPGHHKQPPKAVLQTAMSHVRARDGHVYIYFMSDSAMNDAFNYFDEVRKNFRICQSTQKGKGLTDDDFLPTEVMRRETLRMSLRFSIRYNNGAIGDFFMLRGETTPEDNRRVHEDLRQYENLPLPWTTIGKWPNHSTIGEGYTWMHFDAYASFASTAMQHAWENGMRECVEARTCPYFWNRAKALHEDQPISYNASLHLEERRATVLSTPGRTSQSTARQLDAIEPFFGSGTPNAQMDGALPLPFQSNKSTSSTASGEEVFDKDGGEAAVLTV